LDRAFSRSQEGSHILAVVTVYSILIISLGAYGIAAPRGVLSLARRFASGPGIAVWFLLRFVFAIALWLAADASATPTAFRILSVVVLLGAISLPAMGEKRLSAFIARWSDLPTWSLRAWLGAALVFGLFILGSSVLGFQAS
jgi:hypothetical protein